MISWIEDIAGIPYLVVELDASKGGSDLQLFHQLSEAFGFPFTQSTSYGDVLLDYMRDLKWLPQKNFKLIIRNTQKAEKKTASKVKEFWETLEVIREYWEDRKRELGSKDENNFIIELAN